MSVWLKTSLVTMAICAIGLGIWIVSVPRERVETETTGPSVTAAAPSKPDVARATARKSKRTPGAADTTPPWPDPSTVIVASYLVTQPKLVDRIKPLLQRGTNIELAAQGFRTAEQFAAVAHAAHDLDVPFVVLKQRVLGDGLNLSKAIAVTRPDVDANEYASRAVAAARADVFEANRAGS
jgi:hypothetical protein